MPQNHPISLGSYSTTYSCGLDANKYKYGFNGKEKDNETNAEGGDYDFGARIYDSRLGRWLACDPESGEYPSHSSYVFVSNSPIIYIDNNGCRIMIQYQVPVLDKAGNPETFPDGSPKYEIKYYEYGSKLVPPDDPFVKSTIEALDYDCKSRAGKRQVLKAMNDPEYVQIVEGAESFFEATATVRLEDEDKIPYDKELLDDKGNPIFINRINFDDKTKTEAVKIVKDKDGKRRRQGLGKINSASIALLHEIKHFNNSRRNYVWYRNRQATSDKRYDTKEERRVIRFERRVARQLGENGRRRNHTGFLHKNKGVTDHEGTTKGSMDSKRVGE